MTDISLHTLPPEVPPILPSSLPPPCRVVLMLHLIGFLLFSEERSLLNRVSSAQP